MIEANAHRLLENPRRDRSRPYGESLRRILSLESARVAGGEIRGWPGYRPTPLQRRPGLAERVRVGSLFYKDEATRFGLGSFKALGGAYGVLQALRDHRVREPGETDPDRPAPDVTDPGEDRPEIVVTCASAGNHGRAVAWGCRMFGVACVIFLPEPVARSRETAIRELGAEVVRAGKDYDETVRIAQGRAEENGWRIVSDTAYPGSGGIPRHVMRGYALLVEEALDQLPGPEWPTHVFVQAGVGGLAAAVCGYLWDRFGRDRPTMVVVEPEGAACCLASALEGEPTAVAGDLATRLSCLACRRPSRLAWRILDRGADFFLEIPDAAVEETMRILADGSVDRPPVVAGPSGAAGLAGLLSVVDDERRRDRIGLDGSSRVLLIGTEGATDAVEYRRIVGRSPARVAG